jgi:hypothetical protein
MYLNFIVLFSSPILCAVQELQNIIHLSDYKKEEYPKRQYAYSLPNCMTNISVICQIYSMVKSKRGHHVLPSPSIKTFIYLFIFVINYCNHSYILSIIFLTNLNFFFLLLLQVNNRIFLYSILI